MGRMPEILDIEKKLFNENHSLGMARQFNIQDKYLNEIFFKEKGIKWCISKVEEECTEVKDVFNQLQYEMATDNLHHETVLHLIEEVGDFILACSSVIIESPVKDEGIEKVRKIINMSNKLLSQTVVKERITVNSVWLSNVNKINIFYSAVRTYEGLISEDDFEISTSMSSSIASVIRRTFTLAEIQCEENKEKIIKLLRNYYFMAHMLRDNRLVD